MRYVKDAALAHGKETFLYLSPDTVNILREGYLLNFHALSDLREESLLPEQVAANALQLLERSYSLIQKELSNSRRIEIVIEDILRTQPEYRQTFIDLLNKLKYGGNVPNFES